MNRFFCSNITQPVNLRHPSGVFERGHKAPPTPPATLDENNPDGISPASINALDGFSNPARYIYVVGYINARFPSLSVENEFYQTLQIAGNVPQGLTAVNDQIALKQLNQSPELNSQLYTVLSQPQNTHLAREMFWTLNNHDNNAIYALLPASDEQLLQMINAIAPQQQNGSPAQGQTIAVGREGPAINGSPTLALSNIIDASATGLIGKIAASQSISNSNSQLTDLVNEILSLNANDGYSDDDRALNYTLYYNLALYKHSYQFYYDANSSGPNPSGYQLINVRVFSSYSGDRIVAKVIFDYQGINSGAVQSWYSSVDVTGEYPFTLTQWQRYLPRD